MALDRIAETTLADGKWVSTVRLRDGAYSTQEEAEVGHKAMVKKWSPKP
jgi:hypothetical protein